MNERGETQARGHPREQGEAKERSSHLRARVEADPTERRVEDNAAEAVAAEVTPTAATHWGWPLVAASLPWPMGFAMLGRLARSDTVRFATEEAACACARRFGGMKPAQGDDAQVDAVWRRAFRLVQLVDHADLFLARSRSDRWLAAHADVRGAWPEKGPFLAMTFHWGAGLWALRHLGAHGPVARFLARQLTDAEFGGDAWRRRYMRLRIGATEAATRAPVVYTGGATAEIERTLGRGMSIVALCDVPLPARRSRIEVPFRGGRLAMPRGLIALACANGIPVVSFSAGLDRTTGRRPIDIAAPETYSDPDTMAAALAARLDALLERDSAAWHMWPYAAELLSVDSFTPVRRDDQDAARQST